MKTIYLNDEYECSVTEKSDTVMQVQTDYFDGKCNAYIEGYRFVPEGRKYISADDIIYTGEMIVPFKDYMYLEMVQAVYDQLAADITDTQLAVAELYESEVALNG